MMFQAKNMRKIPLINSLFLAFLAGNAAAAGVSSTTTIAVQHFTLKDESQQELGLGDAANALELFYKRNNRDSGTVFTAGVGFASYDDQAKINQNVTINGGRIESRRSEVRSLIVEVDYGIQRYLDTAQKNYWNLRAGYTALPLAKRTTKQSGETCNGCAEEKFTIDGGAYGAFAVGHYFSKAELSLEYRQYAGGDLNNGLLFNVGFSF